VPNLLILIASVRSARVGGAVGEWVARRATEHGGFTLDVVDLAELRLPLMEEPEHPKLRRYAADHTKAWSERVDAADGFVLVMPEYNHSFTAPLKNALDYLVEEWRGKPVGTVSYGGLAGGSRAVVALEPVLANLELQSVRPGVEIAWVAEHLHDGAFVATERHERALTALLAGLASRL
jgi:NAD(P)H-dependent FMN reductase